MPGIEISAVEQGRDVHVLGYFIDTESLTLQAFLDRQRRDRQRRIHEVRDRLAALGYEIDVDGILADARRGRSVGRPQIAAALVQAGHVGTRDEAFDRFLEFGAPAYVPRAGTPAAAIIDLIHHAGGVASLAHPGLSRRDELISALAERGLDAIEACHSEHDAATEAHYRRIASELGLAITGGSDFHADSGAHRVSRPGLVTLPAADYERLTHACAQRRAH